MRFEHNSNINNQASVFGEEFNLKPEEIINIIEKVCKPKYRDTSFDPKEVEIALYNCDYYIRPGAPKTRFVIECMKILQEYKWNKVKVDLDSLYTKTMLRVCVLIKNFFDEEYFNEKSKQRKTNSALNVKKVKLVMYLKRLDKGQLESFFNTIFSCRSNYGLFISDMSSATFWEEIRRACIKAGLDVPFELDSLEGQRFLYNNKGYYFKVLSTKTIASMLSNAIDLNIDMATSAAKKLRKYGYPAMLTYINTTVSNRDF